MSKKEVTGDDIILRKKPSKKNKDPLDFRLDRPLTDEELAAFGKSKRKKPSVVPFIKLEKNKGLCTVIGIKGTF